MKKMILIIGVAMGILTSGYSQDKGYIGLEFGLAIPGSDYADTNTSNNAAGYATTGYHIGIAGTYQFNENWGIAYSWRIQKNGVNTQTLADQAAADIPNTNIEITTESYFLNGFMVGAYITIPISEKLHWDTKGMLGLMTATKPNLKYKVTDGTNTIEAEQKEVKSSSFAFNLSTGLRYDFADKFAATFSLESVFANPSYKDVETETRLNGTITETSKETYSQTINNLNIGLGIVYRFN